MPVRRLDTLLVDRIAAGEVVERPAAAVKELVENALDAGARRIEISIEAGGRECIRVIDDGVGMDFHDLDLSVERHATSKIPDGDLSRIVSLGFRGEALPSIASVSRTEVRTRTPGAVSGLRLVVDDGVKQPIEPCALLVGTRVEVRRLFSATPARLKFLKSERSEALAVADVVRRLGLSHPQVGFVFTSDEAPGFDWPPAVDPALATKRRIEQVLGAEFIENSLELDGEKEGVRIRGRLGLPTFSRANANQQFFFVNGRSVRDKLLSGALRAGYMDFLPKGRHAAAALWIACEREDVDVNVHPAKTEVRFRDSGVVRSLLIGAIRKRIGEARHLATTTGGSEAIATMRYPSASPYASQFSGPRRPVGPLRPPAFAEQSPQPELSAFLGPPAAPAGEVPRSTQIDFPLGAACAQLHNSYIVAQTRDGMVLVDQHAAHERIVYERLKREREAHGIERQALLQPVVVELDAQAAARLVNSASDLAGLGLLLEGFGPGAVLVREAPALISAGDLASLVRDLADDACDASGALSLERRLDHRLATIACHHSVRAGRRMKPDEMNVLLREMESTPGAGQCNHGRPTYVELKLVDIERLFGRR